MNYLRDKPYLMIGITALSLIAILAFIYYISIEHFGDRVKLSRDEQSKYWYNINADHQYGDLLSQVTPDLKDCQKLADLHKAAGYVYNLNNKVCHVKDSITYPSAYTRGKGSVAAIRVLPPQ